MSGIDQRYEFAIATAKKAGALALRYFNDLGSLTIQSKGVQDMASEADVNTEALIRREVAEHFAGDAFLGEESSQSFVPVPGEGTWIIDPIDGTQPFINGIRSWCISIAYYQDKRIRIGVVYDPTSDELFAAQEGKGATLNGRPIRASSVKGVQEGLVSVGFSNRVQVEDTLDPLGRLLRAGGMFHRSGSGALSLSYVAAGRLIGYFEPHMNSWDFAAGALLVREAGGITNDCLPNESVMIDGGMIIAGGKDVYAELEGLILDRPK